MVMMIKKSIVAAVDDDPPDIVLWIPSDSVAALMRTKMHLTGMSQSGASIIQNPFSFFPSSPLFLYGTPGPLGLF